MSSFSIISVLIGLAILFQLCFTNGAQAGGLSKYKKSRITHSRTFVTPKSNPEHFLRFNASRTCGKGFNPMDKRHRNHHRFKRAHGHIYPPWRPGCPD